MHKRCTHINSPIEAYILIKFLQPSLHRLKESAPSLLGAGEDELWHATLLRRTNLDQTTTDRDTIVAADTVGCVGSVDGDTIARTLLGCFALRSNGATGDSPKAAEAGLARKAATSATANAVGVVV
jgi:hypothetical protein